MVKAINGDKMNNIINNLKKIKKNSPDLVIKKIKSKYIAYFETVTSSDKVNEYILKFVNKKIPFGPNSKSINNNELFNYLVNGFTAIIHRNKIIVIETKANISRSIDIPNSEPSLTGPKDSFTENIQTNLGLIKRRIKDENLNIKNFVIGRRSKTITSLLSIKDITDESLINKISKEIEKIDIDVIIDSADLALLLEKNDKISFPTIIRTERPDVIAKALTEGKIAILVDTSCYALILPAFLIDFINPKTDSYSKSHNINFVKILRLLCFIITIIAPALYISLINYNQETIPTSLLINFSMQRNGVPFPAVIEALIMIILCEILRESDLRFPNSYGSAISILGALIIGEAAVSAGIVSPIMIIVIAITFISSLIFTEYELISAVRHYRFIFLLGASTLGILGIVLTGICFLAKLCSVYNYSISYTFPLAPYEKEYFNTTLFKEDSYKNIKRSRLLAKKNIIKQRRL